MKDEFNVCIADVQNRIYEAGLFRQDERVVFATNDCVLLEYFTGKAYSYRMVDLHTLKAKRLFTRINPLTETGYQRAFEKMLSHISLDVVLDEPNGYTRAEKLLIHIFYDILPENGLLFRENQLSIALSMLTAMEKSKVALCEAEVGTGKTHAYILAAVIYRLFHVCRQPVVISTSTIALQKAVSEEYIPQISNILLRHRIIDKPLTSTVRKGKKHYACESRVKIYLFSLIKNCRPEDKETIQTLSALFEGACTIDLDGLHLTDYVKKRICVERCQQICEFSMICRYRAFLKKSGQPEIDFLIVNHNLVFADMLNRKGGKNRLLPEYGVLIIDEAHKLLDAARQMYGISFENLDLERLSVAICHATSNYPNRSRIVLLCEEMLRQNELFFINLIKAEGAQYDCNCTEISFTSGVIYSIKALISLLKRLSMIFYTIDRKKGAEKRLVDRIDCQQSILMMILDETQSVCWLEHTGIAGCRLCSLPKQLDFILYEDIWNRRIPNILTSATLSVEKNFEHFMHQTGIDLLNKQRILTISKASPFDYQKQALLYLPKDMPFPEIRNKGYMEAVIERLKSLIYQTNGHMLILFTSYWMMERIYQELSIEITEFPLFCMRKGHLEIIDAFRKSGNGVLFASDSAGEGIDLAGDVLSSLVVVKLPFRAPNPIAEYERTQYEDFQSYLSQEIIPGMLIKLRQWIGRGIRRESDTCVFSILDSRAVGRYKNDILSALPNMPVTDQIEDVGRFLLSHKDGRYFDN